MLTQSEKDSIQLCAQNLGVPVKWLDDAIYLESNYNPQSVNGIGATGLIQFVRSTAKSLGTNTDALFKMNFVEQMKFVEIYLQRAIKSFGMPKDFISFYCLIFNPSFVHKDLDSTLPAGAYYGNRFLDLNHDGTVTKGELQDSVNKRLSKKKIVDVVTNLKDKTTTTIKNAIHAFKSDTDPAKPTKIIIGTVVLAVGLIIIRFIFRKIFLRKP